jgi:hypothetical protein
VEPAGVEPASAHRSFRTSTCVFCRSVFLVRSSAGRRPLADQLHFVSSVLGEAPYTNQPDLASFPVRPRARSNRKRVRKLVTQPMPVDCWHLLVLPLFFEVTAPRHAAPNSLNTSNPFRPRRREYSRNRAAGPPLTAPPAPPAPPPYPPYRHSRRNATPYPPASVRKGIASPATAASPSTT